MMFRCEICQIDCTGPEPYKQHNEGKSHLKKVNDRQRMEQFGSTSNTATQLKNSSFPQVDQQLACGASNKNVVEFNGLSGFCHACNVALTSVSVMEQHVAGAKHIKRVQLLPKVEKSLSVESSTNNSHFTGNSYSMLLNGRRNLSSDAVGFSNMSGSDLTLTQVSNNLVEDKNGDCNIMFANSPIFPKSPFQKFCDICNVPVNTSEQFEKHIRSPKHLKKEEQVKRGVVFASDRTAWFQCDICNKRLNSTEQLQLHKKSHLFLFSPTRMINTFEASRSLGTIQSDAKEFTGESLRSALQSLSVKDSENGNLTKQLAQSDRKTLSTLLCLGAEINCTESACSKRAERVNSCDEMVRENKNVGVDSTHNSENNLHSSLRSHWDSDDEEMELKKLSSSRQEKFISTEHRSRLTKSLNSKKTGVEAVDNSVAISHCEFPNCKFHCSLCDYHCVDNTQYESHCKSNKHEEMKDPMKRKKNDDADHYETSHDSVSRTERETKVKTIDDGIFNESLSPGISSSKNNTQAKCFDHFGSDQAVNGRTSFVTSETHDISINTDSDTVANVANLNVFVEKHTERNVSDKNNEAARQNSKLGCGSGNSDSGISSLTNINPPAVVPPLPNNSWFTANKFPLSAHEKSSVITLQNTAFTTQGNSPFADFDFYCELCNVPFDTAETQQSHMRGKKHRAALAKTATVPHRFLGAVIADNNEINCTHAAHECSQSIPRPYQIELFLKAMKGNKVVFLPTGTGKTLVSAMAIWYFLKLNPRRSVMFLVDRILLVLQQQKVLLNEFGDRTMDRYDESTGRFVERHLRVASLCGGEQVLVDNLPLWQHDVVVATAAFYSNLLSRGALRWSDNCLVVFDEAHHCMGEHPFNTLLRDFHLSLPRVDRPLLLGLTASPAGKDSVAVTEKMLQLLLFNMGDASLVMVEKEVEYLKKFQSNAQLLMKQIDLSPEEQRFTACLHAHLKNCLERISVDLMSVAGQQMALVTDCLQLLSSDLEDGLHSDVMDRFLMAYQETRIEDVKMSITVQSLFMHIRELATAFLDMREIGLMAACEELNILLDKKFQGSFEQIATLGVSCDELVAIIESNNGTLSMGSGLTTTDDDSMLKTFLPVFKCVLTEILEVDWGSSPKDGDTRPIVLVLVKQRKTAEFLSRLLKSSTEIIARDLKVIMLVGHGKIGSLGMNVRQQQKQLKTIRDEKAQVIVATSVAEEGLDLPSCELVIHLDPPSTVQALVQVRGRARKKDSRYVALFREQKHMVEMQNLLQREKYMIEAVKNIVQKQYQLGRE